MSGKVVSEEMGKGSRNHSFIHSFSKLYQASGSPGPVVGYWSYGDKYNRVSTLNNTSVFECDTMNRCYFCNEKNNVQ